MDQIDRTEELYDFGLRLKALRKRKNYTQKELAMKLEVESQTIYKYESNQQRPSIDKMIQMAVVLDTSLDYLAGREKGQPIYIDGLSQDDVRCLLYIAELMKKAGK